MRGKVNWHIYFCYLILKLYSFFLFMLYNFRQLSNRTECVNQSGKTLSTVCQCWTPTGLQQWNIACISQFNKVVWPPLLQWFFNIEMRMNRNITICNHHPCMMGERERERELVYASYVWNVPLQIFKRKYNYMI